MKKIIIAIGLFTFNITSAQVATKLDVADTRSVNDLPNFNDKGIRADFKARTVIGVPGSGGYSTNLTFTPWTNLDNTGNKTHQLNFNDGGIFYRNANPLDAQWGSWGKLLIADSNNNLDFFATGKLVGHNDPTNYFIGTFPITGSSGLNLHWFGGIKFGDNTGDVIRIKEGKVGIGTNSPLGLLHVGDDTGAGIVFANKISSVPSQIPAQLGWGDSTIGLAGDLIISPRTNIANNSVRFFTNNGQDISERFRISGNGNIGIGVLNPQSKLDVMGDIRTNGYLFSKDHTIESYSPLLILKRDTNLGGFIQGIQTKRYDNTDNWFYGNLGDGSWMVSKGDFTGQKFTIKDSGNVGIGNPNPQYKLDVAGKSSFDDNMRVNAKIEAKEIKITTTPTADFVFEETYNLPKLEEVEKHIKEKKHLPEIASAKEMEKEGVNVGEFQIKLLQKIEELTLYTIEQNKQLIEQNKKIIELQKDIQAIKNNKSN